MKAPGSMTRGAVMALSDFREGTFMKESGSRTCSMDMESFCIMRELRTRVSGNEETRSSKKAPT